MTTLSNYRINPPVGPVTGLANSARPAPAPPAGYAERYTHLETPVVRS